MISVDLDKIVTAKGLQAHLASILFEVEEDEKIYIITKQGKPRAALVNVDYLLELTGQKNLSTTEYDRYETKPERTEADEIALETKNPPATPDLPDNMPSPRQLDKIEASQILTQPKVEEPAPQTEQTELSIETQNPQIADLSSIADTDATTGEDPYLVTDEEMPKPDEKVNFPVPSVEKPKNEPQEQQYDLNGLPIPGQPDASDQVANSSLEDTLAKLQKPITNDVA